MKVTIIQTNLYWENPKKNLLQFDDLIKSISEETNLIILPEMFTTGFTMNSIQFSEKINGKTFQWLKQKSIEKNISIIGSLPVNDNGFFYNRLYFVSPESDFFYDKRHLFSIGNENKFYKSGNSRLITQLKNFKICPLICYDLRFPVWSRNKYNKVSNSWDYDLLIYIANWPEVRNYAWKQLLIARAIENQCYVIGLNRIGLDNTGINHSGDSLVINPRGEIISKTLPNQISIETISLDMNYLVEYRKLFHAGLDSDSFEIK